MTNNRLKRLPKHPLKFARQFARKGNYGPLPVDPILLIKKSKVDPSLMYFTFLWPGEGHARQIIREADPIIDVTIVDLGSGDMYVGENQTIPLSQWLPAYRAIRDIRLQS